MKYMIKSVGNGWYNFENIPQGYIKIANLNCGTDKKALNTARRIAPAGSEIELEK